MNKIFLLVACALPLAAQETPAPAPEASPAQESSPVPAEGRWVTGSLDIGYRWRMSVGGSEDTYRSIVNLGSGPKLLGTEFTIADPKARVFDHIDVRAYNFGDEPYETLHAAARKQGAYDFSADYRNIAYFNNLPSYADPLLGRGIILNERSFDIHRRFSSFQLDLLPGRTVVPYFAYERDAGFGNGITTFVGDANEYPVPNRLDDRTNDFRGGVRLEFRRLHVTLEQGGTTFRDAQRVFSGVDVQNTGNRNTPYLGRTLFLSGLSQAYGITGNSAYSKGLFTANPLSWLDIYGQFLYSRPKTDVDYQQLATGNLALVSQAIFYNGQQYLASAAAKVPHTSASVGFELRPLQRLRIVESWLTDRFKQSGSQSIQQTLTPATVPQPLEQLLSSSLDTTYSQEQTDVLFDLARALTLRGGFRYVWGDSQNVTLPLAGLAGLEKGELRRGVWLGGIVFRPVQRVSLSADVEGASSTHTYYRTSLHDYQRVRARARYQALNSLNVSADVSFLNNQNPTPGINFDFLSHQESLSIQWTPAATKGWSLIGSYTHSRLRSDISYLAPQDLRTEQSVYRDNAHEVNAMIEGKFPSLSGQTATLSLGGSLLRSSGSRPTNYYQPLAKIVVPLHNHIAWIGEWRYYGFGESVYSYEAFRTHLLTAGLRFTR